MRKGYRGMVGAAGGELDALVAGANGPHECPECGHRWRGSSGPRALPAGMPRREGEQGEVRARALEATAGLFAAGLLKRVGRSMFGCWLADCWLADASARTLFVGAPSRKVAWVRHRYRPVLVEVASNLAGEPFSVLCFAASRPSAATFGELVKGEEVAA